MTSPFPKFDPFAAVRGQTPTPSKVPKSSKVVGAQESDHHRSFLDGDRASWPSLELALLRRLKGYVVPADRMRSIRTLALGLNGVTDPAFMLRSLKAFETQLIALGGEYNDELAETITEVESVFPRAHLVEVKRSGK